MKSSSINALNTLYQKDPAAYEAHYRKIIKEMLKHSPLEHYALIESTLFQLAKQRKEDNISQKAVLVTIELLKKSLTQLNKKLQKVQKKLMQMESVLILSQNHKPTHSSSNAAK